VTLAEVFRRHGPAYLAKHVLSSAKAKVWRAIVACRTAVLGGHVETCDGCGVTRHVYHSCRNRHCPQCQTRAKEHWLAKRRQELLPVPYFHLVFTLPHALHALIGQRPRVIYELLFGAASATLTEFAANPRWLGGKLAFSLVLHTWKQDLGRHVHVHALVAGGALTPEGEWKSPKRGFLFPVRALSRVFRGKFIAALSEARGSRAAAGGSAGRREGLAGPAPAVAGARLGGLCETAARRPGAGARIPGSLHPSGGDLERASRRHGRDDRSVSACAPRRVNACSACRRRSSSSASCCTSCRAVSSGFGTTACWPRRRRRRSWRWHGRPCRYPEPDPVITATVEDFLQRVGRAEWARCPHCHEGRFVPTAAIPPLRQATPQSASVRGPP
jgi:hypothetical protein